MAARGPERRCDVGLLICLLAMAAALACTGCALLRKSEKPILTAGAAGTVDLVALRYDLARFGDRTFAAVVGAADTVAAATQDRSVRELTLRWKIRTADVLGALASNPDPRSAFVAVWVVLEEDRQRLLQGPAEQVLNEQADALADLLGSAEQELVEIGRRHFGDERMALAQEEIAALAADPGSAGQVLGRLAGNAAGTPREVKGDRGAVMTILSAPVAAVSSLQGVGDTPTAVSNVAAAVVAFSGMAKQMPERMRWELEMLLLNAGWNDLAADLRTNVDRVGQAAESLAQTAEQLPANVRTETELLVNSLEKSQPELQKTLAGTRETVQGVTTAIEKADGLLKAADATVKEVTVAAQALESTAGAVEALIAEAKGPPREGPEPEPKGEPVTVAQVTELADRAERIVDELRLLVADLGQPMPETAAVNQAAVRVEGLIDRITWRAVAVIATALVAAVMYKLVATAIARRSARAARGPH
jgi:hypothetical protein